MIRAMIVDDVPLFRLGIRATLERRGDFTVIGEATDLHEVLAIVQLHVPDVVLVSGNLTGVDALDVVHALRQHHASIGILVLAELPSEEQLFQFIRVGVNAYEARTITQEALLDKICRVSDGHYLLSDEVLRPNAEKKCIPAHPRRSADEAPGVPSPLSLRELEILRCIAEGNSNKAIARILRISDQTVKNHITSTLKKLEVNDRTAAVVTALHHHWIDLESIAEQPGEQQEQDQRFVSQQQASSRSGKQKQYTLLGA